MKLREAPGLHTELVPDETLQSISTLQMHAPGIHPSLLGAQFKASMDRTAEDVVRSFEDQPFAAHRWGRCIAA